MKKGFTLIELLIVMAVIAGLVGILIPRFRGMQDEADIAKAKGELATLQTALESYFINIGAYPGDTGVDCTGNNCDFPSGTLINARPQIISEALVDPFTGGAYQYDLNVNNYVIYSRGTLVGGYARMGATVVTECASGGYCSPNYSNGENIIYVSNTGQDAKP